MNNVVLVLNSENKIKTVRSIPIESNSKTALISIKYAGICGTDLQIINGKRPDTAMILGHEGVGTITSLRGALDHFKKNQTVVFNPVNPHDQNDILGHSKDGIFQKIFSIPISELDSHLFVPFTASNLINGCLVEPLGTVIYGFSLINKICHRGTIVIIGAGPIGMLNLIYAKAHQWKKVILINKSKDKIDWAIKNKFIGKQEGIVENDNTVSSVLRANSGQEVDAAILCVPRKSGVEALKKAINYVSHGGCINLVGGVSDGETLKNAKDFDLNSIRRANICGLPKKGKLVNISVSSSKKIWFTGHRGTSVEHLKKAMKELANSILYTKIITHQFTPNQAASALNKLSHKRVRTIDDKLYIKGVIRFSR